MEKVGKIYVDFGLTDNVLKYDGANKLRAIVNLLNSRDESLNDNRSHL